MIEFKQALQKALEGDEKSQFTCLQEGTEIQRCGRKMEGAGR
jgi:hypothetical protein